MQLRNGSLLAAAVALTASALFPASASAYDTYTVTFQQGVNGYTGEVDRRFGTNNATTAGGAGPSSVNATTHAGGLIAVDGWDADSNGADSPDQQVFIKFNNIIGTGAGQIPANSYVLGASLTLTTGPSGSDNSGGPIGVGAVLVNWNTTSSTYNNLKPAGSATNGLSSDYGVISRAVGFYDDPKLGGGGNKNNSLDFNEVATANVDSVVRNWVSGTVPNYGFTLHAGAPSATTDAWQFAASNNYTVSSRPKLSVTYTNAPVQTATFQQGVNGYNGTTMTQLRDVGAPVNGQDLNNAFLDGWAPGETEDDISPDDHALIKFDNIFTSQGGSVPDHAVIVKAYLKVVTSNVSNAQTGQSYEVHQMLTNWDTGTRYTNFSGMGPRPGVHETVDYSYNYGMIPNSEVYFDITDAANSWQSGQPNYGLDIRGAEDPNDPYNNANGTSDGWSIYFTGATNLSLRPQLLVSYYVHVPGDANDDGVVNADDFALIDRGFAMNGTTWADGDFNYDGVVNSADYLIIDATQPSSHSPEYLAMREAMFGEDYASLLGAGTLDSLAAVPEPTTLALLAASLPLALRRRRA